MAMSEAAKAARRAYKRMWNAEHRDLVRAAHERYWERKAKEIAESMKENDENTECDENGRGATDEKDIL